jgi:transglutaminase-like putative cysteine protease
MRIAIRHRTDYSYSEPIARGIQYIRLTPRSGPSQLVLDWSIRAPGALSSWTDHFGNICHTLVYEAPTKDLSIRVLGEVETIDTKGIMPLSDRDPPIAAFLRLTSYTAPDDGLRDFAETFRGALERNALDGLHRLMRGIFETVPYRQGETHVHTTAAEALAERTGVCQDHAHIFIAVCRALGVPARYVSGYLVAGKTTGFEEHDASHAWAEALVEPLGWVAFDAANGICPTEGYVRTAIGLDYADAGPVRGVRQGGGQEDLAVAIVLQTQIQQQ